MTTIAVPTPPNTFRPPRQFDNGAEWLDSLGDVPSHRIIFNPWPGTATEADLLRLVERDKRLCELIGGTLVEKPIGLAEGKIATNISTDLNIFVEPGDLGAVSGADSTLRMSGGNVRLPDVAFIAKSRLPGGRVPLEPIPSLSPDLAVEVLSESNTTKEMSQKLKEYFASGTRLAWIVDPPTRTVAVHTGPGQPDRTLEESDQLDGGDVLPGFVVAVKRIFRGLPPRA